MVISQDRLEESLKNWSQGAEGECQAIREAEDATLCLVKTEGFFNIQETVVGEAHYFHDPKDPHKEAKEWKETLDLRNINVLFVYGIGMGYAYEALEEWLKVNRQHSLVFIESDAAALKLFFSTERAEKLLADHQVYIFYLSNFKKELMKFDAITNLFAAEQFKVSALHYYLVNRATKLIELNTIISYGINMKQRAFEEYEQMGMGFFVNYYRNIFSLPDAYLAHKLFGQFKGMPAIICGAGPSLHKNIDRLKTLKDKAVIFAGGTAMNVLNAAGLTPHYGVGIDPNSEQVMRVMINTAFQTPYFYRNRMNFSALHFIHGDHYLVSGGAGYPIATWVDKELGIEAPPVEEGHNVINFSLSIAYALGCNPIIVTGVDLAYTDEDSYAPLTKLHPLSFGKNHHQTKSTSEELLVRKDIYGKPVYTLWKWMIESVWYSKFVLDHLDLELINATEGGIGFPGVANKSLEEVEKEHLNCSYDIDAHIHTEGQEAAMPSSVTKEGVKEVLKRLNGSLEKSAKHLVALREEFKKAVLKGGEAEQDKPLSDAAMQELLALDEEVAYSNILLLFNEHCFKGFSREFENLERDIGVIGKEEVARRKAELNFHRYQFLFVAAQRNALLLQGGVLADAEFEGKIQKAKPPKAIEKAPKNPYGNARYQFEKGRLTIQDSELGLDHSESFTPDVRGELDFPEGACQYLQTFKNGKLHGPSRGFCSNGQLLYEGWYLEGKKEGRVVCYYKSQELYGIYCYKNGEKEGEQKLYYKNGNLRSVVPYKNHLIDGTVVEYYPNGTLKRKIAFKKGDKDGTEEVYDYGGVQLIEAHYKNGEAVGSAIYRNGQGELQRRVTYDKPGHVSEVEAWDAEGRAIAVSPVFASDYFDDVSLKTKELTESLHTICEQVGKVAPILLEGGAADFVKEITSDLTEIQGQIENLEELSQIMLEETGLGPNSEREPIWKTPSLQQDIDDRLQEATKEIGKNLLGVQQSLAEMLKGLFGDKKE